MKKLAAIFFLLWLGCLNISFAQLYVLSSSRWSDLSTRSARNTHSTITIDSSLITISQGETNLYLEIKKKNRSENVFTYNVIDPNDQEAVATFSPEEMTFDYSAGEFKLRYFIDNIQRPDKEQVQEEPMSDTTSASNDTAVIKEDTKIYETADVPPEFPGGKEAMTQWIASNVKYPAAAKRDKIKGLVTVTAVVEKNGSLTEVTVKKDIGGSCGAEAVRAVKLMPTWIPGQIKNEDKRVRVTINIFFPPK